MGPQVGKPGRFASHSAPAVYLDIAPCVVKGKYRSSRTESNPMKNFECSVKQASYMSHTFPLYSMLKLLKPQIENYPPVTHNYVHTHTHTLTQVNDWGIGVS